MAKFKRLTKEQKHNKLQILGFHIERFRVLYIILFILSVIAQVGLIAFYFIDDLSYGEFLDNGYLITQIIHALICICVLVCLFLNKKNKISGSIVAIIFHVYALILISWSTFLCILDISIGLAPVIVLFDLLVVAGLLVVEPIYFSILSLASLAVVLAYGLGRPVPYFADEDLVLENVVNFVMFYLLEIVISFIHFRVTCSEQKSLNKLEEITLIDELTGLLNERSYLNKIDEINEKIQNKTIEPFAVILMDVNNLKATNDAFGHRYGCHLIVRCGQTLPSVFKTSCLFHVGGDEFIVVVEGDDFNHLEERINEFDQTFRYSIIEYEGEKLIFSVARGYSVYQEGQMYRDVLQIADQAMYENKVEIKETYHLKGR